MNRRHVIRGLAASALLPAIPDTTAAKSLEERKREAVRILETIPTEHRLNVCSFSIAMSPSHDEHAYARELFDAGVPIDECNVRVLKLMETKGF